MSSLATEWQEGKCPSDIHSTSPSKISFTQQKMYYSKLSKVLNDLLPPPAKNFLVSTFDLYCYHDQDNRCQWILTGQNEYLYNMI